MTSMMGVFLTTKTDILEADVFLDGSSPVPSGMHLIKSLYLLGCINLIRVNKCALLRDFRLLAVILVVANIILAK